MSPKAEESKSPGKEMRRDDESWSFEDVMGHIYKQMVSGTYPCCPDAPVITFIIDPVYTPRSPSSTREKLHEWS
jgi:hypothetical protein